MVLVLPADCWNSAVFGVVGGWCLRVGWRSCGLDRFSAPALGFGPWFGCFGRMAWRWLIVVVCVIHWDQAVLWCCRGRRISVGQCSCGLVPIPSCDLRFGPGTRLALSSHRRAITSSCRLIITPTLHLVVSQTSQPANRSARQPVRRSPVSFRFPLPDPLFTPSIPPSIRSHLSLIHPQS